MSRRHPWLDRTCDLLERIVWGESAARALEALPEGDFDLAVLPVWGWAQPRIDVGRKSQDPENPGSTFLMHVRMDYDTTPVVVLSEQETKVSASGVGLGHVLTWGVLLRRDTTEAPHLIDGRLDADGPWGPQHNGRRAATRALHHLVADGRAAHWELVSMLEKRLRWAMDRAHHSMSLRAGQSALIDDIALEALVTRLSIGDETTDEKGSSIQRLVHRCTSPTAFARFDVEHYLTVSLRRDAYQEVRRALGDPKVGDQVRALAQRMREEGDVPASMDAFAQAYRLAYPGSHVSHRRIAAAMTLGPMLEAVARPLEDTDLMAGVVS